MWKLNSFLKQTWDKKAKLSKFQGDSSTKDFKWNFIVEKTSIYLYYIGFKNGFPIKCFSHANRHSYHLQISLQTKIPFVTHVLNLVILTVIRVTSRKH